MSFTKYALALLLIFAVSCPAHAAETCFDDFEVESLLEPVK
jgi:hypothetical protein